MRRMSLHTIHIVTLLILAGVPYLFWIGQGFALPLANRSIMLSTATPSAVASHTFQITINSTSTIGSIVLEYCANSPLMIVSCIPPAGLSLSGAGLAQQTGNTGFTIDGADSTTSKLVLGRVALPTVPAPSTYGFTNIINPSTSNTTTYVRISTYSSSDGTGSYVDNGSVAFTTATNYVVGAFVPPFLSLCVGVTVTADCSRTSGDSLDLGVLSAQTTKYATSQFAASTNDVSGYDLFVLGPTMTSGNNIIPAKNSPFSSQLGASEFGINLRRNNRPVVGADPTGAGTAAPTSNYSTPDQFSFVQGSEIVKSSLPSDYNLMTVSYIVNVNGNQPPGLYSTTLTYLATAQF